VALLLLPLAPLSAALLLTVSVLRWAPPARARGITSVLGALIAIGAYLVSRSLGTSGGATRSADLRDLVAATPHAWWSTLPSTWPGRALAAAGLGDAASAWGYLAATAVLALALAVLAVLLAAHLFATGWATYHEVGRRRPRTTGRATSAATTARSLPALGAPDRREIALGYVRGGARPTTPPVTVGLSTSAAMIVTGVRAWCPLIDKEWRSLRRDTQVWARLLYPLFVIRFGFYNAARQGLSDGGTFAGASASDVLRLGWFYATLAMLVYLLLIALALPLINREGRSLYLLALAPLSARDILLAKWSFCVLPVAGLVEAILIASGVVMHIMIGIVLLSMLAYAGLVMRL